MVQRIKGTQDFLDMTLFDYIIKTTAAHLKQHHFKHIQTPLIEPLDLFKRSLGTHTDVVTKEMFIIEPRSDDTDDRICLRPEATASTVRAFVQNHVDQTPWKVFTYGPMFRYERPQKGRFRQFHQISIEVIGSAHVSEDVHLIAMLDRLFARKFGVDTFGIVINFLGTREDRTAFKAALLLFLEKHQERICKTCMVRKDSNILRVLDCKNPECQAVYKNAPILTDYLSDESRAEWQTVQDQLSLLSISYKHVPTLVRGLDYYNKTVFEFVSPALGAQSAFCGGGRYDQLVADMGGTTDQPAVGAAIGIERVMLMLEAQKQEQLHARSQKITVILPLSAEQHGVALLLADTLIEAGLCTHVLFEGSLKSMMRKVNKMGASTALIIGSEEHAAGTVIIKNMITGAQEAVAQVDAVGSLKK